MKMYEKCICIMYMFCNAHGIDIHKVFFIFYFSLRSSFVRHIERTVQAVPPMASN